MVHRRLFPFTFLFVYCPLFYWAWVMFNQPADLTGFVTHRSDPIGPNNSEQPALALPVCHAGMSWLLQEVRYMQMHMAPAASPCRVYVTATNVTFKINLLLRLSRLHR